MPRVAQSARIPERKRRSHGQAAVRGRGPSSCKIPDSTSLSAIRPCRLTADRTEILGDPFGSRGGSDALPVLRAAVRHASSPGRPRRGGVSGNAEFPGQQGRPVRQGMVGGRDAGASRASARAARPQRDGGRLEASDLGRGARRRRAARSATIQGRHGRDAVGVFGGGSLTNEKAYLLGKFARVALGTVEHRLQRPLLHVVGGGGGDHGASASIAGLPFPLEDIAAGRRRSCSSAANVAETMPPMMQYFEAQRAQRRQADRRRSAPNADRAVGRRAICALAPGLGRRARQRPAARAASATA